MARPSHSDRQNESAGGPGRLALPGDLHQVVEIVPAGAANGGPCHYAGDLKYGCIVCEL